MLIADHPGRRFSVALTLLELANPDLFAHYQKDIGTASERSLSQKLKALEALRDKLSDEYWRAEGGDQEIPPDDDQPIPLFNTMVGGSQHVDSCYSKTMD